MGFEKVESGIFECKHFFQAISTIVFSLLRLLTVLIMHWKQEPLGSCRKEN